MALIESTGGGTGGDDAIDGKGGIVGVSACDEGSEFFGKKAYFAKASFGKGEDDVGGELSFVGFAFHHGNDGSNGGIDKAFAGFAPGLHDVGGGFVSAVGVGHATDDGVLIGALSESGEEFAYFYAGDVGGDGFEVVVIVFAGIGLRIEGFEVGGASPYPYFDDGSSGGRLR